MTAHEAPADPEAVLADTGLPADLSTWSQAHKAQYQALCMRLGDEETERVREEDPTCEMVVMDATPQAPTFGQVTRITREEINAEIRFDHATSTVARPTTRDRAPRLASIGVRRRTCSGGRPAGASSSRGSPDSEGEPARGRHVVPNRQVVRR